MSGTRRRRFATAWALCAIVALLGAPAAAQQQLGAIQGTITDQTGAVLPGVTVEVTNVATNVSRTTVSNDAGVYRVPSLDPGRYEIKATLQGFKEVVRHDLVVSVGATVGLNLQMQAGQVSEMIVVTGHAPDIQTEKADVSGVVEQKKVIDLPLVSRNAMALAGLQPGVTGIPSTANLFVTEQGLGVNANGQRGSANNAEVDGITISGGPWGGSMLVVPNVEAIQEFQIIANNASAEYGRNAGAEVSMVTKSGSNRFSGSAFEFHRGEGLRSKNIFEKTKTPFERNEFGLSIGGPIRRDQTFFFFSTDSLRQQGGGAALRTVETQQLVNYVRATRPNSIAAHLLTTYAPPAYPTSDLRSLGIQPDGSPDVGTISAAIVSKSIGDQYNTRVDQMLRGGADRIRVSYYGNSINNPFAYLRPEFNHPFNFLNQLMTAGYTSVLSNRTLNELNVGWVRQHGEAGDPTPEAPTVSISGLSAGFGVDFWHPITFTQNNIIVHDVVTMNRGAHSYRMGGELRHGRDGAILHHWERPNYGFQSLLDFINDKPFSELRAVDPVTGHPTTAPGTYLTNEWGLFAQDNWKLRPNLTLNLGLRYENFGNPSKAEGPFNGIILGPGSTRQEQIAGARVGPVNKLYNTEWTDFAPRAGVAWDPSGDAKWVVRAGAGKSYNRINNTVFSDERLNPPLFAAASTNIFLPVPIVYSLGPNYTPNPALGRGLNSSGGLNGARVDLRVVDPALSIPYVYNWFAGIQRELVSGFVLDVNYVGSAGRHLLTADGPVGDNYNRFTGDLFSGQFHGLNPNFGAIALGESRISQDYHGLATQVSRRYAKGFSFQVAYTVGKATDQNGGFTEQVGNLAHEQGVADYDIRHSVKVNAIWEIPFKSDTPALDAALGGWQINAITVYQSGSPFSVTCSLAYPRCDPLADGQLGDRINVTRTDLGNPSQSQWLSGVLTPADYSVPAPGQLSTQPRNAFRGPGYFDTDLSLFKNVRFPVTSDRTTTVQLRLEAFNVFNRANLFNPVSGIQSPLFGRVTGVRDPRIVQIGARLLF